MKCITYVYKKRTVSRKQHFEWIASNRSWMQVKFRTQCWKLEFPANFPIFRRVNKRDHTFSIASECHWCALQLKDIPNLLYKHCTQPTNLNCNWLLIALFQSNCNIKMHRTQSRLFHRDEIFLVNSDKP